MIWLYYTYRVLIYEMERINYNKLKEVPSRKMVANYKQEFVYKELVVAYHKVISNDLRGGNQESQGVS